MYKEAEVLFNDESVLRFENVTKYYIDGNIKRKILDNVSGVIEKGSINVIYGESGCGKTTLLSILSGIEEPEEGSVLYKNIEFYSLSQKRRANIRGREFGIVFQDYNLINELTAEDNIKLPLVINRIPFDLDYYSEIIHRMNISEIENRYPDEMSGGEKQRTAIARAMIAKPDIIFADEPTGSLDEENTDEVVALLENLSDIYNTSIVAVTHNKNLFKKPDNIINIYKGKLHFFGVEENV